MIAGWTPTALRGDDTVSNPRPAVFLRPFGDTLILPSTAESRGSHVLFVIFRVSASSEFPHFISQFGIRVRSIATGLLDLPHGLDQAL